MMMRYLQLLITFTLILIQGHQGWAVKPKFKQLVLTQQWLPTFCKLEKHLPEYREFCSVVPNYERWGIHGLWPQNANHQSLDHCDTVSLNEKEISSLNNRLLLNWVDVRNVNKQSGNIKKFWEQQWKKHGTCAVDTNEKNAQFYYFEKALSLFERFNMDTLLKNTNIKPGVELSYEDLMEKLTKIVGKKVNLGCRFNPDTKEWDPKKLPDQYWSEIRICFKNDFQTLTDCSPPSKLECSKFSTVRMLVKYPEAEVPDLTNSRRPSSGNTATNTNWRRPSTDNTATNTNWRRPSADNTPINTNWRKPPTDTGSKVADRRRA